MNINFYKYISKYYNSNVSKYTNYAFKPIETWKTHRKLGWFPPRTTSYLGKSLPTWSDLNIPDLLISSWSNQSKSEETSIISSRTYQTIQIPKMLLSWLPSARLKNHSTGFWRHEMAVQLSHPPLIQMQMHKFIKSLFQKQRKFLALGHIFSEIPTNPLWSLKLS